MIILVGNRALNWPINVGAKLTQLAPLSENKVPCTAVWINKARLHKPNQLLVVPENDGELAAMKRDMWLKPLIRETLEEARAELIEPAKAALRSNAVAAARANTTATTKADYTDEMDKLRARNIELETQLRQICDKFHIVRAGAGWRQITKTEE